MASVRKGRGEIATLGYAFVVGLIITALLILYNDKRESDEYEMIHSKVVFEATNPPKEQPISATELGNLVSQQPQVTSSPPPSSSLNSNTYGRKVDTSYNSSSGVNTVALQPSTRKTNNKIYSSSSYNQHTPKSSSTYNPSSSSLTSNNLSNTNSKSSTPPPPPPTTTTTSDRSVIFDPVPSLFPKVMVKHLLKRRRVKIVVHGPEKREQVFHLSTT